MLQKLTGIVLHVLKYNDTSNIVDIYTEQGGRVSFLVKIPRSRKSNVRSVLFQPLAFVEVEADCRPNSNLHRVQEAKLLFPFRSLPYHPYKSSIAMFLAEFLYRALREEEANVPLFAYLRHSILWLDECENKSFANIYDVVVLPSLGMTEWAKIEFRRVNEYAKLAENSEEQLSNLKSLLGKYGLVEEDINVFDFENMEDDLDE